MASDSSDLHAGPGSRLLYICSLGVMDYSEALDLQRAVARARIAGAIDQDVLLFVEHPHVVTLGRASKDATFVASPALLQARGVQLFEVERGGDVTYHGPGQLVGYPIFDLKRHRQDLHWYLRAVEEAIIVSLRPYEVRGERNSGYTGVWVNGRKLASIGLHVRDWVTWFGFALNVTTDLSYFDLIVPCGIAGVEMTSVALEAPLTLPVSVGAVSVDVARAFEELFLLRAVVVSRDWLQEQVTQFGAGVAT